MQLYAACNAPILDKAAEVHLNGDSHIQHLLLGRLARCYNCISDDIQPHRMEVLNMVIPETYLLFVLNRSSDRDGSFEYQQHMF